MSFLDVFADPSAAASARWTAVADLIALAGIALTLAAALVHARAERRGEPPRGPAAAIARAPFAALLLALGAMGTAVGLRWGEVNHFPSQTMSEVLHMFTLALLLAQCVLHLALGLARRGGGWAALDDLLAALVLAGVFFVHRHVDTLSTAQRDLPPALQSYWFAPHLVSLIFSYATMGIAAGIALIWFATRFWCGVLGGPRPRAVDVAIVVGLAAVPFVHVVGLPVLLLAGLVFLLLRRLGRLPGPERLARLERDLDDVSFRAFAVGIPFLTAGLWMGAFWAQEAWANYWGWDSKENSALITWLVYVVYIHLRLLGGYRGSKAMGVLLGGAVSVFLTFQVFGYLPDSQKSLHRYTDDGVVPAEGQQGGAPEEAAR